MIWRSLETVCRTGKREWNSSFWLQRKKPRSSASYLVVKDGAVETCQRMSAGSATCALSITTLINCSARMVLNINRESMAQTGFSPPTRVFEAAGAAACLITDAWTGVEQFFQPDREILVAHSARRHRQLFK